VTEQPLAAVLRELEERAVSGVVGRGR
jgi:hypothetical protein